MGPSLQALQLGGVCRSPGQWDSLVKAADWGGGPLRALSLVLGHRNEGGGAPPSPGQGGCGGQPARLGCEECQTGVHGGI